jgi:predicted SnoaL-like aldol condensation-catalyzing enzyme
MLNQSLKDKAVEFLTLVSTGRVREAYEGHVGSGFRHHNPYFHGDADSLMAAMEENATKNPDKELEIQFALQEGQRVVVFSRVRQRPGDLGGAVVHIFRFEGNRIAEFWDIGQEVPEDSVNENGMF